MNTASNESSIAELKAFLEEADFELGVLGTLGNGQDCYPAHYLLRQAVYYLRSTLPVESPTCPFDGIVAAYQLALPMLAKVSKLTPTRRTQLLRRWNEDPDRQNLAWWRNYFKRAATSDFLTGRTSNDRNWRPTIDFFLQPKSMTNIIEGAYGIGSGRNAREEFMNDVQREQDRLLASARGIE